MLNNATFPFKGLYWTYHKKDIDAGEFICISLRFKHEPILPAIAPPDFGRSVNPISKTKVYQIKIGN